MAKAITPALMFTGDAEAAMNFYISLFPGARIEFVTRHNAATGKDGTVKLAAFVLNGQRLLCLDSALNHDFAFTPSTSLFVECESEAEVESLFDRLSVDGQVLMPLGAYPFAKHFAWLNDKFGVSWQLRFD